MRQGTSRIRTMGAGLRTQGQNRGRGYKMKYKKEIMWSLLRKGVYIRVAH
jgi:hypothetical protein